MNSIDRLHELLRDHDGPASRKWLEQTRSAFRPAKRSPEALHETAEVDEVHPDFDGDSEFCDSQLAAQSEGADSAVHELLLEDSASETVDILTEPKAIAALLVTPSTADIPRLKEVYAGDVQHKCLSIGGEVGAKAALIVSAKVGPLMAMQKVFEDWGFTRCSGIYLHSEPLAPNVTECAALVLYERGGLKCIGNVREWPVEPDPNQLADLLLEGVTGRRVHIFAKSESPGWESILGEENWQIGV